MALPPGSYPYQVVGPVKAKFHYTGPTGPAWTLSETRTDPTEFLGDPGRKKVRAGLVGPV